MTQDDKKRAAAAAAIAHIADNAVVGVGSGTTVHRFIEELARIKGRIRAAVSSSEATTSLLRSNRIALLELNDVTELDVYIDGADEATRHRSLVKGGGGALTREKILAAASRRFVCIIDDSKIVDVLGRFPVAVEVIPMARSFVGRELAKRGGQPVLRAGYTTDNGNLIIDVHNLKILDPPRLESELNQIPGVVSNGIFARRPADLLLIATDQGIEPV